MNQIPLDIFVTMENQKQCHCRLAEELLRFQKTPLAHLQRRPDPPTRSGYTFEHQEIYLLNDKTVINIDM